MKLHFLGFHQQRGSTYQIPGYNIFCFKIFLVVLSELPLPKKSKQEVISLFPTNKTSADAWKIIQKHDVKLAAQLANVLSQINTDHL